jgi:uncharacterized protein
MENTMRTLIVPGLNGSGPEHWQTLWEKRYGFERVEQRDWARPNAAEWVENLHIAIVSRQDRVVIVAHSLGCFSVIRWAEQYWRFAHRVRGVLLVAPPDISSQELPESVRDFALRGPVNLPFLSILVGSENDPYMTLGKAQDLGHSLGSRFVNAGEAGHINVDSGHGQWPLGEILLLELFVGNFTIEEIHNGPPRDHSMRPITRRDTINRASR